MTIGNSSRDPQPSDPGGLVFNKIARDAVCVVTNPTNPLGELSQEQVQDDLLRPHAQLERGAGRESARPDRPRHPHRRLRYAGRVQKIFMGASLSVAASAPAKSSNGLVNQAVRTDDNAIGYVSLDFTQRRHAVPYKGVACTLRNAKSGQYPGVRNFWLVTRGSRDRRRQEVHQLGAAQQRRRGRSSAPDWVPLR